MRAHTKGFSFIEMILYSALLSGILAIVLLSIYPLFRSIEIQNAHLTEDMEALFIIRKISYLTANLKEVQIPTPTTSGSMLQLTTVQNETHRLKLEGATLLFSHDSDPYLPLTSSRVSVDVFTVSHHASTATTSEMLEITFMLSGIRYGPLRTYLH